MYLTQQTFPPADIPYGDRVLLIKANGGTVIVEALMDLNTDLWVQTDVKSEDGGFILACGSATIRITPSGGASFDLLQG